MATPEQIDAAARHLREATQASRVSELTAWDKLGNVPKRKWRKLAEGTLAAAGFHPVAKDE